MRIVHLEAGRHLYGGARQVMYLIAGLAERGVENVLICPRGSAIAAAVPSAEIVELELGGDLDFGQTGRIARVLEEHSADLLHVHSRRGADLYGGRAARRAGLPAVITRRVESREPAPWLRYKLASFDRIIAISQAIRADLVERVGCPADRVVLIASAVDTQRFRPRATRGALVERLGFPADSLLIGSVAQLIPRKGHETILEAFAELTATRPSLRLVFFGRGPLARRLERHAAALGLAERLRFAGHYDDLADILPELELLVHPAEREGLGVAVLEALAAGVPVVASDAGGLPDIIEDGVTGLRVPRGNAAALVAAVARLLDDRALRAALSERGRRRVESAFSIATMVTAYLAIYEEVLKRHD